MAMATLVMIHLGYKPGVELGEGEVIDPVMFADYARSVHTRHALIQQALEIGQHHGLEFTATLYDLQAVVDSTPEEVLELFPDDVRDVVTVEELEDDDEEFFDDECGDNGDRFLPE
jgi:hypothetical protein